MAATSTKVIIWKTPFTGCTLQIIPNDYIIAAQTLQMDEIATKNNEKTKKDEPISAIHPSIIQSFPWEGEESAMRSMTVFNYLLEATLFGSVLILLLVAVRLLLRRRLGSRALYAGWLVVAVRLLVPLSIPNPFMDSLRPGFSTDVAARPVADQVRQRLIDTGYNVSALLPGDGEDTFARFALHTRGGETGRWFLLAWLLIALCVLTWLLWRTDAFQRRVRRSRVRGLDAQEQAQYETLCERYRVKPVPVYYADRIPAACLVGIMRPFICLPLDTPKEHFSLLLSHQLCHLRARDPFWGLVRSVCCAVHWFNPMVWMAAWLSYRDSEMACDDRVTAKLHDMDRLAYANVIVSAGERENAANMTVAAGASFTDKHIRQRVISVIRCVRGSRWGIALGSLAAAAVLLFSFATGESEPLPTIASIPSVSWTASALPIADDMEAIAATRRFLESEFIALDTSRCSFTARMTNGQWLTEARHAPQDNPVQLAFAADGSLAWYSGLSLVDGFDFEDNSYTHRKLTGSVRRYVDAFVSAMLPGTEYHRSEAVADMRSGDARLLFGELTTAAGDMVMEFVLQIEPEVRMLSVRMGE